MKTHKRIIAIFLVMMMVGGLISCSSKSNEETDSQMTPTTQGEVSDTTPSPEATLSPESTKQPEYYVPEEFDPAIVEGKKLIAITVDDGPDGAGTDGFVNLASQEDIALTFFVVGKFIENNPDQLEEMLKAGCEIGNHSMTHGYLTDMTIDEITSEIEDTNALIKKYAPGAEVSFVRAPYFAYNDTVYETVGYPLVDAAIAESGTNYEATLDLLLNAKDGDIVLMHTWNTASLQALTEAIPILEQNGFAFVTMSQLFEARDIEPINGSVYRSVGKNLSNDYEVTENLFAGEATADGDWNNWETAVELSVDTVVAMEEGMAIKVEYSATAGPCLILSSWTGGPNWVQMTPSSDTGSVAFFTYEDMYAAYGEDFESLSAVYVRPYGADLTVTCVDLMSLK